jgi:hypothetical protein
MEFYLPTIFVTHAFVLCRITHVLLHTGRGGKLKIVNATCGSEAML